MTRIVYTAIKLSEATVVLEDETVSFYLHVGRDKYIRVLLFNTEVLELALNILEQMRDLLKVKLNERLESKGKLEELLAKTKTGNERKYYEKQLNELKKRISIISKKQVLCDECIKLLSEILR